jgi:PBSX family phage terminase large subunit
MINLNDKYKTLFEEPSHIRYYIVTGGRGSGKSFGVTIWANLKALQSKTKILFTRYTLTSAEVSIIPEFTEKIEMLNLESKFLVNKKEILGHTGGEILFRGIKTSSGTQTANLKSLSGVNNWILDEAEELHDEKVFDKIDLSIRSKDTQNNVILILNPTLKEHWIYKRFFEDAGVEEGFNGTKDNVCYIHSTYLDNLDNLSESFLNNVERIKSNNPTKYQNEILGGWLDAYEGVLFAKETLNLCTDVDTSKIEQLVAYVDVATSRGGDYHCAVVGGIIDKKLYILDVVYTNEEARVNVQLTANLLNKWNPEFCRVESNGAGALYSKLLEPLVNTTQLLNSHTTANKQTRLFQTSGWIKDNCVFYSNSVLNSDYHHFFRSFTTYLMDGSSPNDDAPDAVWGLSVMVRSFYPESFNQD